MSTGELPEPDATAARSLSVSRSISSTSSWALVREVVLNCSARSWPTSLNLLAKAIFPLYWTMGWSVPRFNLQQGCLVARTAAASSVRTISKIGSPVTLAMMGSYRATNTPLPSSLLYALIKIRACSGLTFNPLALKVAFPT